jgi:hypothetical protein
MTGMRSFDSHCRAIMWHFCHLLGGLLLVMSSLSCISDHCPSHNAPPAGSLSDFLTVPGEYDGFEVQVPKRCNDQHTILTVIGSGTNHFWTYGMECADPAALDTGVPDACGTTLNGVLEDVSRRLRNQGVSNPWPRLEIGSTACEGFALEHTMYLHLERWQDADLAIVTMGALLSEHRLGEALMAIVEPEIITCAL